MKIILFCLIFAFAGCVSEKEIQTADYGSRPENVETKARQFILDGLRDPDSAKIEFGGVLRAAYHDGIVAGWKAHFGWVQIATVNAKNGFGGYTGKQDWYVFFDHGIATENIYDTIVVAHMGQLVGL